MGVQISLQDNESNHRYNFPYGPDEFLQENAILLFLLAFFTQASYLLRTLPCSSNNV